MTTANLETKPVPALVRAKSIIDAICDGTQPRGVSDLARELGLPRSTVHGLCRTLVDLGLLVRVGQTSYAVGPHVLVWSNAFDTQNSLSQAFSEVADTFDRPEAINLSILTGREVMYVGCRPGTDPLGVRFREGLRFPAPFTATGKAIMSTMDEQSVVDLFSQEWPAPNTAASVSGLDQLLPELAETRDRGYSIDNGQLREAMTCFGAPVFSAASRHEAVAAIAIGVLGTHLTAERERAFGESATAIATELSRRLGGSSR
ncbi:hypothetical protein AX769_07330 [Frondihabitans sp. PAMC 28766]|uniref:IclR family transcriptional regulator n=1 Tax=Frondihabitans sp. PAMC 28766 TaxID=1795630 RepID=UPI00078E5991|nr:IclR family transcriptional regulator [Frondihabitans sp. PAMC 28766]AMM20008.1 hypothetical protein AX769_07330 [Frondihabitans sp. PAMC 28766]